MIKVAITGGIGSGKTTVCKIFGTLGIPVYYADTEAKRIMNCNPDVRKKLIGAFGPAIYRQKEELDRKYLADIIFNDKLAINTVNGIVHPAVRIDFERWANCQQSQYVIEESAIIFESGLESAFDKIIAVVASTETRIKRVISRDETSKEAVAARMSNQISDKERISKSDYIIYNNDNDLVIDQVIKVHNNILGNGKIW